LARLEIDWLITQYVIASQTNPPAPGGSLNPQSLTDSVAIRITTFGKPSDFSCCAISVSRARINEKSRGSTSMLAVSPWWRTHLPRTKFFQESFRSIDLS
jgi:hypothetical protein